MSTPSPTGWFSPCATSACLQMRRDGEVVTLRATAVSTERTLTVQLAEMREFVAAAKAGDWDVALE